MRRRVLLRSVKKYLRPDDEIRHAAQVWQRHRLMVPFVMASFILLTGVAAVSGFDGLILPAGFGVAGAAIAGTATTSYTIVVLTNQNLLLLRGSRIRVVANGPLERLPANTKVARSGGSALISTWRIGDRSYNATKSHERELSAMQNE